MMHIMDSFVDCRTLTALALCCHDPSGQEGGEIHRVQRWGAAAAVVRQDDISKCFKGNTRRNQGTLTEPDKGMSFSSLVQM